MRPSSTSAEGPAGSSIGSSSSDTSALTVLDMAPTALTHAQERLGDRARDVTWMDADVLDHHFDHPYAVWHDRAVFHFLTDPGDRDRYVAQLESAVEPGGHVIIATFSPDGPESCSGLPVQRHSPESLTECLGWASTRSTSRRKPITRLPGRCSTSCTDGSVDYRLD